MPKPKPTPHNIGNQDCARLLSLIAQAKFPLHEAPEWLVIAYNLGWQPTDDTLEAMAQLVSRAYKEGWRPKGAANA